MADDVRDEELLAPVPGAGDVAAAELTVAGGASIIAAFWTGDATQDALEAAAEAVDGDPAYASLSDIPEGTRIDVVDCFVASERVGAVVDEVIAQRDRLGIGAVWLQLGVVDEAAAARAAEAGLEVVMDTCPRIEWPRVATRG